MEIPGKTKESVAGFTAKAGYTLPMATRQDANSFNNSAEDHIPRTYLISRDGKILF
jgi:hypothetical protein